jgi:Xaa-Pro dipeptidase
VEEILVERIQEALKEADLDGWLFYSFRGSDPIAANILGVGGEGHMATRRWFYLIPRSGEPTRIVHSIERDVIDQLPGKKLIYLPWQQLHEHLKDSLTALTSARAPRVAMQYSPDAAIPYLSRSYRRLTWYSNSNLPGETSSLPCMKRLRAAFTIS